MKKINLFAITVATAITVSFSACKENESASVSNKDEISTATLSQIASMGFSTDGVRKVEGGYLVEGDIVLTDDNLANKSTSPNLNIAETEQYRTTNLVKNLP